MNEAAVNESLSPTTVGATSQTRGCWPTLDWQTNYSILFDQTLASRQKACSIIVANICTCQHELVNEEC